MYNPNLHFHFTGIGGVGMSGIAEILINLGFRVSGSDLRKGETCQHLSGLGAEIFEGHSASHVPAGASLLVYSSAVREDNPEVVEAVRRGIPVISRAEVLAELMRLKYGVAVAGSHGKTTTTSLIASIMEAGHLDPTVIIGGKVKAIGSGAKLGRSDFLVAESDESDRSFLLLKPTVAVVTNIDEEHLTAYESLNDLEESFRKFVSGIPFYGLAIFCIDDPRTRRLAEAYHRRKITYGFFEDAQLRAENVAFSELESSFDVVLNGEKILAVRVPMPGRHFVQNTLAAIAVGLEFSIPGELIREALADFAGVGRRLEMLPPVKGITIINDYGHHPSEVRATLSAIRVGWKRRIRKLHVVFQPHRYTRTRDCFNAFIDAFGDADTLILTGIYPAGEDPIEEVTGELLASAIRHPAKKYVESLEDVVPTVLPMLKEGDFIVCLGAGSIGTLPEKLYDALKTGSFR